MARPKTNHVTVIQKWADDLRAAAGDMEQQAKSMRRAADVLEDKYLPKAPAAQNGQNGPMRNQYGEPVINP